MAKPPPKTKSETKNTASRNAGSQSDAVSAQQFLSDAYALDDRSQMSRFYSKWAADYDNQMLDGLAYESPQSIVEALVRHLDPGSSPLLDVGCGTGLAAQSAAKLGFDTIDGLDLSPAMLAVAKQQGLYRHLMSADLLQPLAIVDEVYAGIVSCGTFTHGHVGPQPLSELARVLVPGGVLACTVHFDLWKSAGFDSAFSALCETGKLQCEERLAGRFFVDGEVEGWFCVYRKKS